MSQTFILIADDDEDDRLFLRQAIEKHWPGATICEAEDGLQASNCLQEQATKSGFDLLLLDLNMPYLNGFQVLDQIRSTAVFQHTPAIMISTSDQPEQVNTAYRKGVNAYIKKPVRFDDYDTIIKAIETCFLNARSRVI